MQPWGEKITERARSATWVVIVDFDPGVSGGVIGCEAKGWVNVGGRYVIPIALWRAVISPFWGMKLIVTSPESPSGPRGAIGIRWTDSGLF